MRMKWTGLGLVLIASLMAGIEAKCTFLRENDCNQASARAMLDVLATAGLTHMSAEDEKYVYNISICEEVRGHTDVGVLQTAKTGGENPHVIGLITDVSASFWDQWLFLDYHGGDPYGTHCGKEKRMARVTFTCAENQTQAKVRVVEEHSVGETGNCLYMFEIRHKAMCTKLPTPGNRLSTGSILLIIFFTFVGAYLVIGAAYQRFVAGAKGIDQVPHLSFWQDFGNLQADGCDFICRGMFRSRQSPEYHGITGDQVIPEYESETVRDDSLLPM